MVGVARTPSQARTLHLSLARALDQSAVNLCTACVLIYVIWSSGDNFSLFGLRRPEKKDIPIFLGVLCYLVGAYCFRRSLPWVHNSVTVAPGAWPAAVLMAFVLAFRQELLYRSYLMTRIQELTGSKLAAYILPAAIFPLATSWSSASVFLEVFVTSILFALLYRWKNCIWPVMVGSAVWYSLLWVRP